MTRIRKDSLASSILIIDRDPLMLTAMASVLDMQGHRAVLARTEEVAMDSILRGQFDVIVLSIDDLNAGCLFASKLRSSDDTRDLPIIFLVPEQTKLWTSMLAAHGGVFSMLKPIDPDSLLELVDKALWMPHVARCRIGAPNLAYLNVDDWVTLND